jgi:3'-5' exoribonuclease
VTRIAIHELSDNVSVEQAFQATDKQLRVNRQGGKYILLKLADRTGTISGMVWNADERTFESFQRGDYIFCRGRTQLHNGNLQIIVTELNRMPADDVDSSDFDRFDSQLAVELTDRLTALLTGLHNVHLRRLAKAFLGDAEFVNKLQIAPAAINNHHAYPGGLLQHTVDLIEIAQSIGPRYKGLDVELLMFGAFLHDLGKIDEITSGGESTYTDRGQLIGHLVIGVQMLDEKIRTLKTEGGHEIPLDLQTQLQHLILSHHGLLEFGSPRIPHTLEAIALHHIDNLDAKMAAALSIIDTDVSGSEYWTNYHPGIGRKLWKPKS